jgi:adenylate cyclase, class 2
MKWMSSGKESLLNKFLISNMDGLKYTEVELKYPLYNSEELRKNLNSIAQPEKEGDTQVDTYYIPSHRNFLGKKPISEWLRIRESMKGGSVNYKKWHNTSEKAVSCDEYETKVENIVPIKKIFENLDLKEIVVVEKTRYSWSYKDTTIALDSVKGLGDYIEIEAKGNFKSIDEAKEHLYLVLGEIGAKTGEQDFEGYPLLLLRQKGLLR